MKGDQKSNRKHLLKRSKRRGVESHHHSRKVILSAGPRLGASKKKEIVERVMIRGKVNDQKVLHFDGKRYKRK